MRFPFAWLWSLEKGNHQSQALAKEWSWREAEFSGQENRKKPHLFTLSFVFLFGIKNWWRTQHFFTWLILQYLRRARNSEKIRIPNTFHIALVPFQPEKLSQILKYSEAAMRAEFSKEFCSLPAWHFWKSRYWFWCLNGSWALLQICFWSCMLSCSANSGYHCSAFLYFLVVSCAGSKTIRAPQGNHSCYNQEAQKISGATVQPPITIWAMVVPLVLLYLYGSELCNGRCCKTTKIETIPALNSL